MARVFRVTDRGALDHAAVALAEGLLVVLPTDTVYGIAARVDKPEALSLLFAAKGRSRDLALPVLVADTGQARTLGKFSRDAELLAQVFWPGPLTIVVERTPHFSAEIGGDGRTVGLRVPDHEVPLRLTKDTGPLATSSANKSGEETPSEIGTLIALFGEEVGVYLDAGPARAGPPSTVVSVEEERVEIIREGGVTERQIRDALEC